MSEATVLYVIRADLGDKPRLQRSRSQPVQRLSFRDAYIVCSALKTSGVRRLQSQCQFVGGNQDFAGEHSARSDGWNGATINNVFHARDRGRPWRGKKGHQIGYLLWLGRPPQRDATE